MTGVKRSR